MLENVENYAVKCIQKAQFEHIESVAPPPCTAADFSDLVKAYFTKWENCVWRKVPEYVLQPVETEGESMALWPVSVLHLIRTLNEPR